MIRISARILPVLIGFIFLGMLYGCKAQEGYRSQHSSSDTARGGAPSYQMSTILDTSSVVKLVAPPADIPTARATIFLESIQKVQRPDTTFLIVKGNFSNGCTQLKDVSHSIRGHTLYLDLEGWQPKNKMCTQVLTPFTYLYKELHKQQISDLRTYFIRGDKKTF